MTSGDLTSRILLRAPTRLKLAASGLLDTGRYQFRVRPMYDSAVPEPSVGVAAAPRWHVLTSTAPLDDQNAWDACHQLLDEAPRLVGARAGVFAEPDIPQRWLIGDDAAQAFALASVSPSGRPQSQDFPVGPGDLWFQDRAYAQFHDALQTLGAPTNPSVRVAHFDTGFDPDHLTVPEHLNLELAHNFVDDGQAQHDARDTSSGLLNNIGHGTGTVGVLAGNGLAGSRAIGAAPFVEVVPMRVANSVVLFYNGDIAAAFRHVRELNANRATRIDIVTMSMGGLASLAWAEHVNALYEDGVFIVTAAGNNIRNLPTRNIVFPARFQRVVAACGVMADYTPYADLEGNRLAGNYGPTSKMSTAMAAFTPNAPWARFQHPETIDLDGSGTSCATPQIAAAAAMWLQVHKAALAEYEPWQRVEALRKALFDSAANPTGGDSARLGRGLLRANEALAHAPAHPSQLRMTPPDSASFPLLRTLFGIGVAAPGSRMAPERRQMLELEALQLAQSASIEQLLPDPSVPPLDRADQIRKALLADTRMSATLRRHLEAREQPPQITVPDLVAKPTAVERLHLEQATNPKPSQPTRRRLRVYAYDPSLGSRLETLGINLAAVNVRWEDELRPGPVGEYLEVVDIDPQSQCCYAPIDLNHPYVLVQDGLAPSETDPRFQQQMVYAIAMNTIQHFEQALGRVALWAPRTLRHSDGTETERYVQRLRIYPHASRTANAFYSPRGKSLLLGYFAASETRSAGFLPGGIVYTALSSDIVAHETTHALLDGLHRRFLEPTNLDVLAFHEAFADIVALFQHFSMPEALRQAIASTRGDLRRHNLLPTLAVQFGHATGKGQYAGLRNAIGTIDGPSGEFVPHTPSPSDYQNAEEAHERGAVLVAAVFDAFLRIYAARSADLLRLATSGSGILEAGAIPEALVDRLAQEASKAASHVLTICIRALDYCPVVDITFGEYLRALITADRDLVPDDERRYRVAFVSAFRDRGIYPADVKTLSEDSLVWEPPPIPLANIEHVIGRFELDWDLMAQRQEAYSASRRNAVRMRDWLRDPSEVPDDEMKALGLMRHSQPLEVSGVRGRVEEFEVHSVRPARRVSPDGHIRSDAIVEITQTFHPDSGAASFHGSCTLLIDLRTRIVRYLVRKRVDHHQRFHAQQEFARHRAAQLREPYTDRIGSETEPFAFLHRAF